MFDVSFSQRRGSKCGNGNHVRSQSVGSTGVLKEAKSQMLNKNSEKAQRDEVSVKQAS